MDELPTVLAFVNDLIFASKIDQAAELTGFRVIWMDASRTEGIVESESLYPGQLAEPLEGSISDLVEQVTTQNPALIIIDLNDQSLHWQSWLRRLKSAPATRRIPIICYGSHVDADTMLRAKNDGAEAVVARSKFAASLPDLMARYARLTNIPALIESCELPLSDLAVRGIELFNRGQYFEAHEELELAWKADDSPGRELYRSILQVAVAYLQIERGNYNGAIKMFWRVRQWITPLPPVCRGVNVDQLKQDAELVYQELKSLGKEHIGDFDRRLFHPVEYQVSSFQEKK